ncbi:MAG: hypothetical protein U5N85_20370 [Arcicella sp.]|nr:hypothetical protein [Arcicella sp.]
MGLIKEPIDVDFSTKSEPWTDEELTDFRKMMKEIKAKNTKSNFRLRKSPKQYA